MSSDYIARGLASGARAAALRNFLNDKLLRAAERAEGQNPVTAAAWLAPPAYLPNTAYAVGQVVANAGSWYMCGIAGTSPAASGGPTTTTSGQYIQDGAGTLYWTYLGGARAADPGDGAPTVTTTTNSPSLGLVWNTVSYPALFTIRGAYPTPYRDSFWELKSFDRSAGNAASAGASVVFRSDEAKIAIFLPANGQQYRIIVDGRYLMPGSLFAAGGDSWVVIDWTATSGRRSRTYEVETNKSVSYFGQVQTSNSGTFYPVQATDETRLVWISDSYAAGSSYGPWLAGGTLPQLVGKRLGWRDVWNLSTGGTGYTNPGTGFYTFPQRAQQVASLAPDVIVVMGSSNDAGSSPTAITAAALATFQTLRSGNPLAPIIVFGVPSIHLAGTTAAEAAVQAAVATAQQSDPNIYFLPICGDTVPWLLGSWNNGGAPANADNSAFYIGGDSVHPPEIGTDYLSTRCAEAIRRIVFPQLVSH